MPAHHSGSCRASPSIASGRFRISTACGDGVVQPGEDCDDGNTTDDGNGCGTDCQFRNTCGDGVLEPLAEHGGVDTATCDTDCTAATCGDGHFNPTAGEECDDGPNGNGQGRCSVFCTLVPPPPIR